MSVPAARVTHLPPDAIEPIGENVTGLQRTASTSRDRPQAAQPHDRSRRSRARTRHATGSRRSRARLDLDLDVERARRRLGRSSASRFVSAIAIT